MRSSRCSAYWIERHKTLGGLPDNLRAYVENMREAARAVTEATDLEGARVAAQRIAAQCQGCHAAEGVMIE